MLYVKLLISSELQCDDNVVIYDIYIYITDFMMFCDDQSGRGTWYVVDGGCGW